MIVEKKNGAISLYGRRLAGTGCGGHLCFDCQNAYIGKCKKVYDVNKRGIEDYDFIIDGFQDVNREGVSERLLVMKCKNFVEDERIYKKGKHRYKN